MIDSGQLLTDLKKLTGDVVDDLRTRTDGVEEVKSLVRGQHREARSAGRTDHSFEEWREDLLAQVAVAWVLATVFVRFCEDNGLVAAPNLSGPGDRRQLAGDHRADWLADNPAAGDREWLEEVFRRYRAIPATAELFGDHNPLWQFGPTADGAKRIIQQWQRVDPATGQLKHDFTDPELDTRFLGDLYQDLSDHAKKTYALLQTPVFVEEFILDYTLDPAIKAFGLDDLRMIDPTCGSGHFLLGAFDRILALWREREPGTPTRELVQRTLDAVNGVDLNPFAAAIARFRLLVAALRVSKITELADAPRFRINVAVGDSLLHGVRTGELFAGTEGFGSLLQHRYPTEDEERANQLLEAARYHAVVGNPPYIAVKDGALRDAYRSMYKTAHGKYSLGVPFTERFFDLATTPDGSTAAGYVGMITTNTFMKRSFGKKLIEEYLPRIDLTHIIDTSGAYIPGHGTPTVILFGRHQPPEPCTIRTCLGIRGEPGRPDDPSVGAVWSSIISLIGNAGAENDFVSVEDADRHRFAEHPWSLQGGAAATVKESVEQAGSADLGDKVQSIGITSFTLEDDAYLLPADAARRLGLTDAVRPMVTGDLLRDWNQTFGEIAVFPYDENLIPMRDRLPERHRRYLWRNRELLKNNKMFGGKTKVEAGLHWTEFGRLTANKLRTPLSITFAFVATHNHFVLDRGGKVFKQSAPVIKLSADATVDDHLALLGLLNSSTACFWMKQVFHGKGQGGVGQESRAEWEEFLEFDGTKLKQFPIPSSSPTERAQALDEAAQQLAACLPRAVFAKSAPTRERLTEARDRAEEHRARMVALQEELDWQCYHLYGLTDEDLSLPSEQVPSPRKGQRAFEVVLARRMADGKIESTWFERHGSTPVTELPDEWPEHYKSAVEVRISLIESDRNLGLLERPEYKRRWNWDEWDDLEKVALRDWLLDRMETEDLWAEAKLTTTARVTDRLRRDQEVLEAARLYAARVDVNLTELMTALVEDQAVPFMGGHRYSASGLRKRRVWERVWDQQRAEDEIDVRVELPEDDEKHLTPFEAAELKVQQGLDQIEVPPKYTANDYQSTTYWRLRGKLDVPKERFILYPGTHLGADATPVIGWAGWDHLQQARALAAHYSARRDEGADPAEVVALLAGLQELVPWLLQWHNELDPAYGQRMGEFFATFTRTEARSHSVTEQDLMTWTPE